MQTEFRMNMEAPVTEPLVHLVPHASSDVLPSRARTLRYTSNVSRALNEGVLKGMGKLLDQDEKEPIGLFVTSPGGATGTAMSFYDSVRHVLKPELVTVGSGDVDSSGIIIFLTGSRRYVTPRTTFLLHPAGRLFGNQRYTTREMDGMLAEDRLKNQQYAAVVAESSKGKLTVDRVLEMMEEHTVLTAEDMVMYGLAHGLLS